MKLKPLIGITAGEITNKHGTWAPLTYGQSYTYVDAIVHAGGVPIIVPITSDKTIWRQFYERCDGFLFAGGNDIDPKRYDQKVSKKTTEISTFRDNQEFGLMSLAVAGEKPFLAICRGMQLLNVHCGGSLFQHIPDQVENAQNHEISTTEKDTTHQAHVLTIAAGSKLAQIVETTRLATNSHHHQAVNELGEGLTATAWAEDGVVEGIELVGKKFAVAVQSHPESLEAKAEPTWRKLFIALVAAT